MTQKTLTLESLIALLRQHNGTITQIDRGMASQYIAHIPEKREISPFMFMALERALDLVSEETEKGITTRTYRVPSQKA